VSSKIFEHAYPVALLVSETLIILGLFEVRNA